MKNLIPKDRIDRGLYWGEAWSLVEGCSPVSSGCQNCWAARETYMRGFQKKKEKMKARYEGLTDKMRFNCKIRCMKKEIQKPLDNDRPTVYSIWNDLFHEKVPDEFIREVFEVMAFCTQHRFIILTKRPSRMGLFLDKFEYSASGELWRDIPLPNVILGTSVENRSVIHRIRTLALIPAAVRMVSFEPVLEQITILHHKGINWAVLGVETGPNRRHCKLSDLTILAVDLKTQKIPVFVKSIEINGKLTKNLDDFPEKLQFREFPNLNI